MRVPLKGLPPGMQNGEEADFRTETGRIGSDFQQRCGTGFEQYPEQQFLVLPHQRYKRMRDAEDQVEVAYGQQFLPPRTQPLFP